MKAIIEVSTQEALYCDANLTLDAEGAYNPDTGTRDRQCNIVNCMLVTVASKPADFAGRMYRLSAQGQLVRTSAGDAAAAARLSQARESAWRAIQAQRERLSDTGGYKVATLSGDKWFHSDLKSKLQQTRLAARAELIQAQGGDLDTEFQLPPPLPADPLLWKTMDGSKVPMTPRLAMAVAAAAEATEILIFAVAEGHRAAMLQAADPLAYDYSAGWPAVYGG